MLTREKKSRLQRAEEILFPFASHHFPKVASREVIQLTFFPRFPSPTPSYKKIKASLTDPPASPKTSIRAFDGSVYPGQLKSLFQ